MIRERGSWLCLLVLGSVGTAHAQPFPSAARLAAPSEAEPSCAANLLREHLEPSYMAYPLVFSGLDSMLYEASIAPHLVLFRESWPVAFVGTPKLVLRMWNQLQEPVHSPSYMPRISMFLWFGVPRPDATFAYGSLTLEHHSNGQAGPMVLQDGRVDHSGDFTTNVVDLSFHLWIAKQAVLGHHQLGVRMITPLLLTPELLGRYGFLRAHYTTTLLETHGAIRSRLSFGVTAIFGHLEVSASDRSLRAFAHVPIALQWVVEPRALNLGLFLRYYLGQDYYNVWFDRVADVLQIGIESRLGPVLLNRQGAE